MRLERKSAITILLMLFVATVAQSYDDSVMSVAAIPAQTSWSTTTRARDQQDGLLRQRSMKHLKSASAGAQDETPSSSSWSRRARKLFGGGGDEEEDDPVSTAWIPGVFGTTLTDNQNRRVEVNIGLNGRALTYSNHDVVLDDGASVGVKYHRFGDGGDVFAKEDGKGYYYLSNSEYGKPPKLYDASKPRETYAKSLTGGVYRLEFNNDHEFIGYKQLLGLTLDNCAGGRTPWQTFISCEESREWGWGQCYQVDPEGVIPPEATDMTGNYGTPKYGNFEAAIFFDGFGYVTDDDETETGGDGPGFTWNGAVTRYTPDATARTCLNGVTKAERWCALNSAEKHEYLKLNPDLEAGDESGTFEWVPDINDANPELYAGSEGLGEKDGILIFTAKIENHIFFLNLTAGTYQRRDAPFSSEQQPDNIAILDEGLWMSQDGGDQDGVWVRDVDPDGTNAAHVLFGRDYKQVETAGIAFSPDAKMLYVSFQDETLWQFWRMDGMSFADLPETYQQEESLRYWLLPGRG